MEFTEEELGQNVAFLKVLADKNRLRILALLSEREHTVKELAAALKVTEPTVSHHIGALRRAEVVAMRPEGTAHYYRLRQEDIHARLQELKQANRPTPENFDGDDFELRVIQHFFDKERLREIPTQRKKLLVVLRRLAQEFTPGTHYSEKEVNTILKRFHLDCATLRRQLVDNRFLARQNSFYWRLEEE